MMELKPILTFSMRKHNSLMSKKKPRRGRMIVTLSSSWWALCATWALLMQDTISHTSTSNETVKTATTSARRREKAGCKPRSRSGMSSMTAPYRASPSTN